MGKVCVARCVFVVAMVLTLPANGADKTITNKEFGFEITFPDAWKHDPEPIEDVVVGKKWRGDGEPPFAGVKVVDLKGGTELKEFVDGYIISIKKSPGFSSLVADSELTFAGVPSRRVTFLSLRLQPTDHLDKYHWINYLFVSGKRGYIIKTRTLEYDYDKYAKDIDAIVKSFKLIEAK